MIAPWYSRENMDYCYDDDGCMGVWYRVIPYDGNGINVNSDIVDDTTWYAVDSQSRSTQPTHLDILQSLPI